MWRELLQDLDAEVFLSATKIDVIILNSDKRCRSTYLPLELLLTASVGTPKHYISILGDCNVSM